jgi:hypothetical protein
LPEHGALIYAFGTQMYLSHIEKLAFVEVLAYFLQDLVANPDKKKFSL